MICRSGTVVARPAGRRTRRYTQPRRGYCASISAGRGGEEKLAAYESSPGKVRYFCSRCGSHLVAESPTQSHVVVRVATLDDDPGEVPTMRIRTSHNVPWLADRETCRAMLSGSQGVEPLAGLLAVAGESPRSRAGRRASSSETSRAPRAHARTRPPSERAGRTADLRSCYELIVRGEG